MTTYYKKNDPSTIGPDELLIVAFQDLNYNENQVIIPGTTKLTVQYFFCRLQTRIKL